MVKTKANQKIHIDKLKTTLDKLGQLKEKPKEELSLRESIYFLRDKLKSAFKKGYSYQELSGILEEEGILISASTLKQYLTNITKQSASIRKRSKKTQSQTSNSKSTATSNSSNDSDKYTKLEKVESDKSKDKDKNTSDIKLNTDKDTDINTPKTKSSKDKNTDINSYKQKIDKDEYLNKIKSDTDKEVESSKSVNKKESVRGRAEIRVN